MRLERHILLRQFVGLASRSVLKNNVTNVLPHRVYYCIAPMRSREVPFDFDSRRPRRVATTAAISNQ